MPHGGPAQSPQLPFQSLTCYFLVLFQGVPGEPGAGGTPGPKGIRGRRVSSPVPGLQVGTGSGKRHHESPFMWAWPVPPRGEKAGTPSPRPASHGPAVVWSAAFLLAPVVQLGSSDNDPVTMVSEDGQARHFLPKVELEASVTHAERPSDSFAVADSLGHSS